MPNLKLRDSSEAEQKEKCSQEAIKGVEMLVKTLKLRVRGRMRLTKEVQAIPKMNALLKIRQQTSDQLCSILFTQQYEDALRSTKGATALSM